MLEGLGRALMVPIACEGSIIALRHSIPTKAKIIIVHCLEVSKKEVMGLVTSSSEYI
jgi:hypothetical protein